MDLLTELGTNAPYMPYVVVLGLILLSGLGLPIPEDIPLILAGYLCYSGHGYADPWVLFPLAFLAVVGADLMVFALGRRYGHHVPKLPLMRRFLTEKRLARTERLLHKHGGKFMFAARFMPGLRAPAIFTAGNFRVPYWKFLLYDGGAAMLSVPLILGLAYYFAEHMEQVRKWVANGERGVIAVILLAAVVFVVVKLLVNRKLSKDR
jgi:membrane protein DedA with SNARE-associated domain